MGVRGTKEEQNKLKHAKNLKKVPEKSVMTFDLKLILFNSTSWGASPLCLVSSSQL
jgi:hypothetical protein